MRDLTSPTIAVYLQVTEDFKGLGEIATVFLQP